MDVMFRRKPEAERKVSMSISIDREIRNYLRTSRYRGASDTVSELVKNSTGFKQWKKERGLK